MAMRSVITRSSLVCSSMEGVASRASLLPRYYSDGKGRILSEEERAKENVYIQKLEREQLEKIKKKLGYVEKEKDNAGKEKDAAEKKTEGDSQKD